MQFFFAATKVLTYLMFSEKKIKSKCWIIFRHELFLFFWQKTCFFKFNLIFEFVFLSCPLAKIVNYHDNVLSSLIFAPFIIVCNFSWCSNFEMYVLQKQIVLSEIFRIKCSFSPWNDRIISFWHFQKMFSSSTWYSSLFSFGLQNLKIIMWGQWLLIRCSFRTFS